jgi:galactokinase
MTPVVVRYPGRACLLGEHCDWAGGASLTVPLPMGIEIRAESNRQGIAIHSELDGELLEAEWDIGTDQFQGPLRFVPASVKQLLDSGIELVPTRLWVVSDLPAGRGFSSSAAFTLSILDSLARAAGHEIPTADLVEHAYQVERERLGINCGRLDQAACAAGQPLFIRWNKTANGDFEMQPRRINSLCTLHLVVAAFDKPRDTQRILKTLSLHHKGPVTDPDGDAVREALSVFASMAEQAAHALTNGDPMSLGRAMNTAQSVYEQNLSDRFSSTRAPRLSNICAGLRKQGAIGAKFSGAGGDGSVIALFSDAHSANEGVIWLQESELEAWSVPISNA